MVIESELKTEEIVFSSWGCELKVTIPEGRAYLYKHMSLRINPRLEQDEIIFELHHGSKKWKFWSMPLKEMANLSRHHIISTRKFFETARGLELILLTMIQDNGRLIITGKAFEQISLEFFMGQKSLGSQSLRYNHSFGNKGWESFR